MTKEKLEEIILNALNGKLRVLVDVCNCAQDRIMLAHLLAEEIVREETKA